MALIVKENGNGPSTPPIDPGMYQAVCVGIYDLGTQKGGDFGKGIKMQRKIYVEWEIPDERIDLEIDGKTVNVARKQRQKYTLSLNEKATLRKHLDSWRGRPFTVEELEGFDVFSILGANCYLNIIHAPANDGSGKIYANIASITPLMKKDVKLQPEGQTVVFSFTDGKMPGEDIPAWIGKIMADSPEYKELASRPTGNSVQNVRDVSPTDSADTDDVPF